MNKNVWMGLGMGGAALCALMCAAPSLIGLAGTAAAGLSGAPAPWILSGAAVAALGLTAMRLTRKRGC